MSCKTEELNLWFNLQNEIQPKYWFSWSTVIGRWCTDLQRFVPTSVSIKITANFVTDFPGSCSGLSACTCSASTPTYQGLKASWSWRWQFIAQKASRRDADFLTWGFRSHLGPVVTSMLSGCHHWVNLYPSQLFWLKLLAHMHLYQHSCPHPALKKIRINVTSSSTFFTYKCCVRSPISTVFLV